MFKTSEGETLDLAPWRMRRFVRLLADARRYPPGTPPHVLIQDLRQIIARARRVKTEPRIGTARFHSSGACCNACLLAQQRDGVLSLLGLSLVTSPVAPGASELASPGLPSPQRDFELEFESIIRSANVDLNWSDRRPLDKAIGLIKGPGVYVLARNGRPVYVGQSGTLPKRLAQHLWFSRIHRDPGRFDAWVASVPQMQLGAVEHTIVRALRSRVTNFLLQKEFKVGPRGLTITHLLPGGLTSPWAPDNQVIRKKDEVFEWST